MTKTAQEPSYGLNTTNNFAQIMSAASMGAVTLLGMLLATPAATSLLMASLVATRIFVIFVAATATSYTFGEYGKINDLEKQDGTEKKLQYWGQDIAPKTPLTRSQRLKQALAVQWRRFWEYVVGGFIVAGGFSLLFGLTSFSALIEMSAYLTPTVVPFVMAMCAAVTRWQIGPPMPLGQAAKQITHNTLLYGFVMAVIVGMLPLYYAQTFQFACFGLMASCACYNNFRVLAPFCCKWGAAFFTLNPEGHWNLLEAARLELGQDDKLSRRQTFVLLASSVAATLSGFAVAAYMHQPVQQALSSIVGYLGYQGVLPFLASAPVSVGLFTIICASMSLMLLPSIFESALESKVGHLLGVIDAWTQTEKLLEPKGRASKLADVFLYQPATVWTYTVSQKSWANLGLKAAYVLFSPILVPCEYMYSHTYLTYTAFKRDQFGDVDAEYIKRVVERVQQNSKQPPAKRTPLTPKQQHVYSFYLAVVQGNNQPFNVSFRERHQLKPQETLNQDNLQSLYADLAKLYNAPAAHKMYTEDQEITEIAQKRELWDQYQARVKADSRFVDRFTLALLAMILLSMYVETVITGGLGVLLVAHSMMDYLPLAGATLRYCAYGIGAISGIFHVPFFNKAVTFFAGRLEHSTQAAPKETLAVLQGGTLHPVKRPSGIETNNMEYSALGETFSVTDRVISQVWQSPAPANAGGPPAWTPPQPSLLPAAKP